MVCRIRVAFCLSFRSASGTSLTIGLMISGKTILCCASASLSHLRQAMRCCRRLQFWHLSIGNKKRQGSQESAFSSKPFSDFPLPPPVRPSAGPPEVSYLFLKNLFIMGRHWKKHIKFFLEFSQCFFLP